MLELIRKIISIHKLVLIIHDISVITLGLLVSISFTVHNLENLEQSFIYSYVFLLFAIIWIFKFNNMYIYQVFLNIPRHTVLLAKCLLLSMTFHIYFAFFFKYPELTLRRTFVIGSYLFIFVLLFITRVILIPKIYFYLIKKGKLRVNMLVVGAGEKARVRVRELLNDDANYYKVVGYLDDSEDDQGKEYEGIPVVGKISDIKEAVYENGVNDIFIFIDDIEEERLHEIIDTCIKIKKPVHVDSGLYNIINERLSVEEISSTSTFRVVPSKIRPYYNFIKRTIDIFVSLFFIVLLFPVWIILYLMVFLTSKGPGFYRAEVVGKNLKIFYMLKFRSMYDETSKRLHEDKVKEMITKNEATTKLENDPRITPVGRIFRKYSIDEFPQLWNVLKGDMSLVGPRPNVPYEVEHMKKWQKKRFDVLPGMTGLWQIKGRDEVKFTDQIVLDFFYIENRSIMLDLEILLKTIPVVIFGRGGK